MDRIVVSLFATPVYCSDLVEQIVSDVTPYLKSLEYENMDKTGETEREYYTVNKNVLEEKQCYDLKNIILDRLNDYARNTLGIPNSVELYITNSWVNRINPMGYSNQHVHANSFLSGVTYLDSEDSSGDFIVHKDPSSSIPYPPHFLMDIVNTNIHNSNIWNFPPHRNKLILFPSTVLHSVGKNLSGKPRYSLAFNTFIKGTLSDAPLRQLKI